MLKSVDLQRELILSWIKSITSFDILQDTTSISVRKISDMMEIRGGKWLTVGRNDVLKFLFQWFANMMN